MPPTTDDRTHLGRWTRRALVLAAAAIVGVLGVARRLEPDPSGMGTHRQLGLPPCGFALLTGRPCPSCGMTTAFAWSARARPVRAWQANPAGALLALACPFVAAWLLGSAALGRPWGTATLERPLIGLVVATLAISLLAWLPRMLLPGRAL